MMITLKVFDDGTASVEVRTMKNDLISLTRPASGTELTLAGELLDQGGTTLVIEARGKREDLHQLFVEADWHWESGRHRTDGKGELVGAACIYVEPQQ